MATRVHKALTAVPVSLALALSMALPATGAVREAHADELSDAQAVLSQASAELDSLNKEYDALQAQLSGLDSQINETTQKVQDAQQKMLEGRETLSGSILSQYKGDGSLSLVNIVLSSEDISEFTKNLTYYSSIQEDQAQKVAEQEQLRDTFSSALGELDTQRDEQQKLSWRPCKHRQRKCRRKKRASSKLPRMHRSPIPIGIPIPTATRRLIPILPAATIPRIPILIA